MDGIATAHVHSTWSYDGSWSLEDLSAAFARRGSQILLMTEHDRGFTQARFDKYRDACQRVSSERMLVVPGVEYSDPENRVHVLVWSDGPFLGEGLPTASLMRAVRETGGLAVLAHPRRKSAWLYFDPAWMEDILAVEIWNRKYDGWAPSSVARTIIENREIRTFVGLDFHTRRQFFPLTMRLDLETPLSASAVLDCLRKGRFSPRALGVDWKSGILPHCIPALNIAEGMRRAVAPLFRPKRLFAS
jgi:hypothetical protein